MLPNHPAGRGHDIPSGDPVADAQVTPRVDRTASDDLRVVAECWRVWAWTYRPQYIKRDRVSDWRQP